MTTINVDELIRQAERLRIIASRRANESFVGQYQTSFRGQGIEFVDVREYSPGDDIRFIDWNVSARTQVPHIKQFREERERTVTFLVDVSRSMIFGTQRLSKRQLAFEVAALLMLSANRGQDKVGMVAYTDVGTTALPARRGLSHITHAIRLLVEAKSSSAGNSFDEVEEDTGGLDAAMNTVLQRAHRRGVIFMIGDFLDPIDERLLSILASRHDVVAIRCIDPRELVLTPLGIACVVDPETGLEYEVDLSARVVKRFNQAAAHHAAQLKEMFRRRQIEYTVLQAGDDYLPPLTELFRRHEHLHRR